MNIYGFVDVRRDHGKLVFFEIRDTSGIVQAVSSPNFKDAHEQADALRPEWVVSISGVVGKRPEAMVNPDRDLGDIEISIEEIEVLSRAAELPFDKDSKLNLDTYLDHLPLTLRTERAKAIFRVQARIAEAFRIFFAGEGFVEINIPKIIGEDAEGGATTFEVDYFDHTAHLAQSPQLYKQIMVGVFERVFTVGRVFRAEKHATGRHLNEYASLDIEMGFIKDHHDVMEESSLCVRAITEHLRKHCKNDFALLEAAIPEIPGTIPNLKLRQAQEIIKKEYGEDATGEPDLTPQHERWICEYAKKKWKSDFIYVTHFPVEKRPMYTYEDEEDLGYTKGFDLLFRGLEINTGGQRIHNYDALVRSMQKKGLDPEQFSFYLEAFKFGMPPHGGFGMGLERLTARFLGIGNVKEATLFPRDINRIDTLLSK